jgi:negative regulator of flagellin synthesis FlgM
VELSPLGSQLAGIEASLADVPVVDTQRVEEIKQAISDGRFKVNADVIADRLLETVRELIQSQSQKG